MLIRFPIKPRLAPGAVIVNFVQTAKRARAVERTMGSTSASIPNIAHGRASAFRMSVDGMLRIVLVMVCSAMNPLHNRKAIYMPMGANDNKTLWNQSDIMMVFLAAGFAAK